MGLIPAVLDHRRWIEHGIAAPRVAVNGTQRQQRFVDPGQSSLRRR
jgi:hypothetical protein